MLPLKSEQHAVLTPQRRTTGDLTGPQLADQPSGSALVCATTFGVGLDKRVRRLEVSAAGTPTLTRPLDRGSEARDIG